MWRYFDPCKSAKISLTRWSSTHRNTVSMSHWSGWECQHFRIRRVEEKRRRRRATKRVREENERDVSETNFRFRVIKQTHSFHVIQALFTRERAGTNKNANSSHAFLFSICIASRNVCVFRVGIEQEQKKQGIRTFRCPFRNCRTPRTVLSRSTAMQTVILDER